MRQDEGFAWAVSHEQNSIYTWPHMSFGQTADVKPVVHGFHVAPIYVYAPLTMTTTHKPKQVPMCLLL